MECSICLCDISDTRILITNCGHIFHESCITKHMTHNNTCPLCRKQIVIYNCNIIELSPNIKNVVHFKSLTKENAKNMMSIMLHKLDNDVGYTNAIYYYNCREICIICGLVDIFDEIEVKIDISTILTKQRLYDFTLISGYLFQNGKNINGIQFANMMNEKMDIDYNEFLSHFQNIKSINISRNSINKFKKYTDENADNITEIIIKWHCITNDEIDYITNKLHNITSIVLTNPTSENIIKICNKFTDLKKLHVIGLSDTGVCPFNMADNVIEKISSLKSIIELDISDSYINADQYGMLISSLHTLEKLTLSSFNIKSCDIIGGNLKYIKLQCTNIKICDYDKIKLANINLNKIIIVDNYDAYIINTSNDMCYSSIKKDSFNVHDLC